LVIFEKPPVAFKAQNIRVKSPIVQVELKSDAALQQHFWRSPAHLSLQIDQKKRRKWRNAMKKFLLATISLVALGLAAPASAADLAARPYTKAPPAPPPVYDWSGFYIGANGGGAWSHSCWDVTNSFVPGAPFREGCHNETGGVVGGQIGYRWQTAGWVFGLEAQGDWADLKGSHVSVFVPAWD
jgi:hypothetical protein